MYKTIIPHIPEKRNIYFYIGLVSAIFGSCIGSDDLKKQGFLYGSAVLMVSALIVKLMGAVFRIPLANMLGGGGMGYFSAAYGIFMPVYAVSVTGLPSAAAKAVASAETSGRYTPRQIKTAALRLFGTVGAVGTLIIILGAYPLCRFVSGDIKALPAVMAIAPSVLAGCLVSVYRGYFEGMRNMYPTAVSQVIEGFAKAVLGLALCGGCISFAKHRPDDFLMLTGCAGRGVSAEEAAVPYAAAAAVMGVTLSSFAGLIYIMIKGRGRDAVRCRKDIDRELMRTAVPMAAGALVTNLTSLIDLVTIMRSLKIVVRKTPWLFSHLLGAGISYNDMPNFIYGSFTGLAVTLFNLVPSLTNMLGKSMLPAASAAKAAGDKKRLGECSAVVIFAAAFISVPAGLGISVLADEILTLLFSGRTAEIAVCADAMRVLGLAVPFVCISSAAFAVLQAADRADIPVKLMGIGAAVKLAGNLILTAVPGLNVTGAAMATLICYAVICAMSLGALTLHGELDLRRTAAICARISAAGALCAAGAFFTAKQLPTDSDILIRTGVSCLTGAIIYILSTYFSGVITKSTLKMLIS